MKKMLCLLLAMVMALSMASFATAETDSLGVLQSSWNMDRQTGTMEASLYVNKGSSDAVISFTASVDGCDQVAVPYQEISQTNEVGVIIVVDASLPYCNTPPEEIPAGSRANYGQYIQYSNTHQIILESVLGSLPGSTPVKFYVAGDGSAPTVTAWMTNSEARNFVATGISLTTSYRSCINAALTMAYQEADSGLTGMPTFTTVMALVNPYNVCNGYSLPTRPNTFPFMLISYDQERDSRENGSNYIRRMQAIE